MEPLNILHVFRAPVGGLFRHVADLARGQAERGHRVGLVADSSTGGDRAEQAMRMLEPHLALGITRIPMRRQVGPTDWKPALAVMRHSKAVKADVLHGHGAKGGAYSRMAFGNQRAVRVYTPHGGSLHYGYDTLAGAILLTTERLLMLRSDLLLFESQYGADTSAKKVGQPRGLMRVVHNGVSRAEFEPVVPAANATDLVFLGELRLLKGIDVLISAVASLRTQGRPITATLVGSGPDEAVFKTQVQKAGLADAIQFRPAMPAREAFTLGRLMVVPSRAESLPYVVLEAAAGGLPLIATRVGGIAEIFGDQADRLVPPDDAVALASAIADRLDHPDPAAASAVALRDRVAGHFSVDNMVDGVLDAYAAALQKLRTVGRR